MIFSFIDISTSKFSINGRTMFKTFIPFFIDDTHIKIFNIYDSRCPLIDSTDVADIEVGGIVFANATDLINAIHGVLFSRTVAGDIDNAQIELNRLAIISLQNDKSDVGHVHDDRYYTKSQVDQLVTSIVDSSDLIASGQIDGDNLIFFNNAGLQLFSLDARRFTSQGTIVSFSNGVLTLKNERGEVLSQTSISTEESYYDKFQFLSGLEDDLGDLIPTEKFSVVETTSGLFFFVSKIDNKEVFEGKRLLVNLNKFRVDFGQPVITNGLFKAWGLTGFEGAFVANEFYTFDFWEVESSADNIPVTFPTPATDVATLVTWLNGQNPPIEITANQIPEWELTDGTRYRFENKAKGIYGVGKTQVVAGDFKKVVSSFSLRGLLFLSNTLIASDDKNGIISQSVQVATLNIQADAVQPYPNNFQTTILGGTFGISITADVGVTLESNGSLSIQPKDVRTLIRTGVDKWVLQRTSVESKSLDNNTTTLQLNNTATNFYLTVSGIRTANAATSYSTTDLLLGGTAVVLINTTAEPVVTGATKVHSVSAWESGVDMYMVVTKMPDRVEYFFIKVA